MSSWKKAIYFLSIVAVFKLYSAYNGESDLYSKSFMNIGNEDSSFEEDYKSERIVASQPFASPSIPQGNLRLNQNNQPYTSDDVSGYWKIIKHEKWVEDNPRDKEEDEEIKSGKVFLSTLKMGLDQRTGKSFVVVRSVNQSVHAPIHSREIQWKIFYFERSTEGKGIAITSKFIGDGGRTYVERLQLKSTFINFITELNKKPQENSQGEEGDLLDAVEAKLLKSPFDNKYYGPDSIDGKLEIRKSVLNLDISTNGLDIPGYDIKNISISNARLSVTPGGSISTAVVDTDDVRYSITVFKKQLSKPGEFERIIQFIGGPYNNLRVHFSDYNYEKELQNQEENLRKAREAQQAAQKQVRQDSPINEQQQFNQFKERAREYQDEEYEDDYYSEEEEQDFIDERASHAQVTQVQVDKFLNRTGYSF